MWRWAAPYLLVPFLVLAIGGKAGVGGLALHQLANSHQSQDRYGPITLKRQQEVRRQWERTQASPSGVLGFVPSPGRPVNRLLACVATSPVSHAVDPLYAWRSLQL